jgi:preprotein translocase subunit SecD
MAINAGYERATGTILDSNITTLIAGIALFAFGSGPVKGFAVVLCLGILTSVFTAVFVSRGMVNFMYGSRRKLETVPIGKIWIPEASRTKKKFNYAALTKPANAITAAAQSTAEEASGGAETHDEIGQSSVESAATRTAAPDSAQSSEILLSDSDSQRVKTQVGKKATGSGGRKSRKK